MWLHFISFRLVSFHLVSFCFISSLSFPFVSFRLIISFYSILINRKIVEGRTHFLAWEEDIICQALCIVTLANRAIRWVEILQQIYAKQTMAMWMLSRWDIFWFVKLKYFSPLVKEELHVLIMIITSKYKFFFNNFIG
jgi:hypothetical protein